MQGTRHQRSATHLVWDRHFDQIADGVADGIVIVDENCQIQHANAAAERIFGIPKKHLIGKRCDDPAWHLSSPDGTPLSGEQLCCYRALKIGETSKRIEQVITRPDGGTVTVLVSASPLRDEEGRTTGAINSYSDITELKQADQALREDERNSQSLLRLYRELGQARSYSQIRDALRPEIERIVGFKNITLYLLRKTEEDELLLLDAGGPVVEGLKRLMESNERFQTMIGDERFLVLPVAGNRHLEAAMASHDIFFDRDLMDPNNPAIVTPQDREILRLLGEEHSVVAVHLTLADERLGFLGLTTHGDEGIIVPNERQFDYLRALANHVAVAVDRVRFLAERREAEEALRERAEYDQSLLRLYGELGQAISYRAIVEALLPEIETMIGIKSVGLYLLHEDEDHILMLDLGGPIAEGSKRLMQSDEQFHRRVGGEDFLVFPITGDPHCEAIVAAQDIRVDDDLLDPGNPTYCERQAEIATTISYQHTVVAVPLWLAGKKIGLLCLATHGDEGVHHTTEAELDYLRALANHVAVAMDRVRSLGERRLAEEALRRSESRLRDIIGNTNAIIYLKDLTGRFLLANDQFARLFGMREEDVVGKTGHEVFPAPDMALEMEERERRVRETGTWFQIEEAMKTPSGERVFSSVLFPLRDASGAVYAICGVSTDITEARHAQEELRRKDRAVRQAYVDVLAAVTGNKLILMTSDEISDALGELVTKTRRISSYRSLARARAEIRTAIAYHFPAARGAADFIVGVCEGLTNSIKHGGSGRYEVRRCGKTAQVVISDKGPGVDFTTVPKATLEAGFSTQGTLGVGFTIMLEMSDRVLLSTEPGETILVLELNC